MHDVKAFFYGTFDTKHGVFKKLGVQRQELVSSFAD